MYLKHKQSGDLVEVMDMSAMIDPCSAALPGRIHAGEEMQEPATFKKGELEFPSGEVLPRCWLDPHYRQVAH